MTTTHPETAGPEHGPICSQCKVAVKKLFRVKYCYACWLKSRGEAKLLEIIASFWPSTPCSLRIWSLYLEDLRQGPVKPRDLVVAQNLATALAREPVIAISSWSEARALSRRLSIQYTRRPKIGCPVLKIAIDLEREGKIAPRVPELAKSFDDVLWVFEPKTRETVERYLEALSTHQESPRSRLKSASDIRRFYRFVCHHDRRAGLLGASSEVARAFFSELPVRSQPTVGGLHGELRRFYAWCIREKLCHTNPFEDWGPTERTGLCQKCGETKKLPVHTPVCGTCALYDHCEREFNALVAGFRAPSPYTQHLFDLYVKYCRRSRIVTGQVRGTQALTEFLSARPELPAIGSWSTVLALAAELATTQPRPIRNGCPIRKIGRMLEELGVLPPRQSERDHLVAKLLSECPDETAAVFRQYDEHLGKAKYAAISRYGTIRSLVEFHRWLEFQEPGLGLFGVQRETIERYIQWLRGGDRSGIRRYILRRFYRWAKWRKLTLHDPIAGIGLPNPAKELRVCTDDQIQRIESFVKNPKSDPEHALILALVLYWGVSMMDLALASIDIKDGHQITIVFHRKPLSRGRTSYYRDQTLKLPLEPEWLSALQRRYLASWRLKFEAIRKDFPLQPLILGRRSGNRPMNSANVMQIYYAATATATGHKIPPNVLRRTSGHIHVDHGQDASRLSKLGWAKSHSHNFVFRPRVYFQPK